MIALDTNIIVYAHRKEMEKHDQALRWLRYLAEGTIPWGLPVFCIGEFMRVVTHKRVFSPPSTPDTASAALDAILSSPTVRILNPGTHYVGLLKMLIQESEVTGNLVFDAQIAAVCREHGIKKLLTDDKDFLRFRDHIEIISPAAEPAEL